MSRPLPINLAEAQARGWDQLDVIFVTGDAYIDHPAFGVPLLARWLEKNGFRVGIIAQPDWRSVDAFKVLGRPRLFFGVSAGAMDSMVAHYTPQKKLRRDDAYTPGNRHGARPNRASIIYTSRLKEAYRDVPILLGGIEASMRRFAHYDFWDDKVRRSLLVDAKADLLVFGMGERAILELAVGMRQGKALDALHGVPGIAYLTRALPEGAVSLPAFEEVSTDVVAFAKAQQLFEQESNPYCGRPLAQRHGDRWLVCTPPSAPLAPAEMDVLYRLPFSREPHPVYREAIPAFEQIRLSITTHRGCFGGCSFCAIAQHQGKFIQSRSIASIRQELESLASKKWFRGQVSDLGGPTANMYGLGCAAPDSGHSCRRVSCLFPSLCRNLRCDDQQAVALLKAVRGMSVVQQAVVSSGVRHDLMECQPGYFQELVEHHVGGLLKVAPEHLASQVTALMRKPAGVCFERFLERFRAVSAQVGKRQAVVPYLMAGHPGSGLDEMVDLALALRRLGLRVEQVQEFTPTPGSRSTCMYYSGIDPENGEKVLVCRSERERRLQKGLMLWHIPEEQARVRKLLQEMGRTDLLARLEQQVAAGRRTLPQAQVRSHKTRPRHKKTPR